MLELIQNQAAAGQRRVPLYLVSDTDGKTPQTGVSLLLSEIRISRNGGAETNAAGVAGEIGAGLYFYEFTAAELGTLGFVTARVARTGTRAFIATHQVKPPPSTFEADTTTTLGQVKAKTDLIPAAGPASAGDYTAARAALLDRLDVAVSTRLAAAAYTAPSNADVAAIKLKTDLIPVGGPAAASEYTAARAALLDRLDAAVSSRLASLAYTAPDNAGIATLLSRIDVVLSTRLAAVAYTAPDNATIAAIDALLAARLDVVLSTRMAGTAYVPPPGTDLIADRILGRSIKGGIDGGRTVGSALAISRNKVVIDQSAIPPLLKVYDVDDVTVLWQAVVFQAADSSPYSQMDPSG